MGYEKAKQRKDENEVKGRAVCTYLRLQYK
jgi:hypothetical protein